MIKVTVPATSANIGGGFDCMGLALNLYNEIYVREHNTLVIDTDSDLPADKSNLVYKSMELLFGCAAKKFSAENMPGILKTYLESGTINVYLKQINNIPKTSGLGSSAACIVGGVLAANALLSDALTKSELIELCVKEEGHPDNALPALLGGCVAACMSEEGTQYIKAADRNIRVNIYTPAFPLETSASRKVLPKSYALSDVVYSLSRAVLTFAALSAGDLKLLKNVVGDKLHQPYRCPLIADFDSVATLSRECGAICTYLSGAGPSVASFVTDKFKSGEMRQRLQALPNDWHMFECSVAKDGATVELI